MSPRPFVGEAGLAASSEAAEFVHLFELEFSGGVVRLNTGAHDLVTEPYAVTIGADATRYMICNPVAMWPTTAFSIEFWGKLDADAETQSFNSAFAYARTGQFNEIQSGVAVSSGLLQLIFAVGNVASGTASYPDDNAEHHVVFTWNSTGGAWAIYLDGALVASGTGLQAAYSITGGGAAVIGQEQDSVGGGFDATQAWKGQLDDVRVYRRVLTATEVLAHYQRRFVNEQKLVGLWSFDTFASAASNLGKDSSPIGNHMTVFGITTPATGFAHVRREWEGVGGALEFGGVQESSDMRAQGVDLKVSGVDQSILAILMTNDFRGRPVRLYRAYLDSALGTIVPNIIPLFQGRQLDSYTVTQEQTRQGGTVTIATRVLGLLGMSRARGILANLASHQHYFPGDTGFQNVASLAHTKVYWGTAIVNPGTKPSKFTKSRPHG